MEYEMGRGLGAWIGVGPENKNKTQTMTIGEGSAHRPHEGRRLKNSSQIHRQMESATNWSQRTVNAGNTSQCHRKMNYKVTRPQRALHEDEVETSESYRGVRTTP